MKKYFIRPELTVQSFIAPIRPRVLKFVKIGTDEIYDEAVDVEGASFTYEETEYIIERTEAEQSERIAELEEALDMIFEGVTE